MGIAVGTSSFRVQRRLSGYIVVRQNPNELFQSAVQMNFIWYLFGAESVSMLVQFLNDSLLRV